jgi:RNA polymerase sigma-70 factor (ECF subfamily)
MIVMLPAQRLDAPADEAPASSGEMPIRRQRTSFEAIYDEHFDFIWRSVRRLGVSEAAAEDLVQEIFIVVHRRLHTFEGRSKLQTWLFGIALRMVRNHRRAMARERARTPDAAAEEPPAVDDQRRALTPHSYAEKLEARRILYRILDELDDDKREVFVLAELEQLPLAQIAEVLSTKLFTVYSRLRAARAQFQRAAARYRARDGWRYP